MYLTSNGEHKQEAFNIYDIMPLLLFKNAILFYYKMYSVYHLQKR